MPWWVWLVLALFMLAMFVAGVVYAVLHGIRAMKTVSPVGRQISERLDAMSHRDDPADAGEQRAIFTEPLRVAADRYADAHAVVVERRERRRDRYAQQWAHWSHFNE